jgi:DNA-binding transcriptional ArsR family regulator
MNVTEICEAIHEEQSNVSHNLKKLVECHFIEAEKKGKHRVYSLNKETIMPLMQLVGKHVTKYCCKECPMREVKK